VKITAAVLASALAGGAALALFELYQRFPDFFAAIGAATGAR
jgi:hypothetical protein